MTDDPHIFRMNLRSLEALSNLGIVLFGHRFLGNAEATREPEIFRNVLVNLVSWSTVPGLFVGLLMMCGSVDDVQLYIQYRHTMHTTCIK